MVDFSLPPKSNEIEISLFGPGYGEALLVHFGKNHWVSVDSCVDEQKNPITLKYLEAMGLQADSSLKQIIATHWHDDHIRGISKILKACPDSEFICSSALRLYESRIKRYSTVQKTINEAVKRIGYYQPKMGHIRIRCLYDNLDDLNIELFGNAQELTDLLVEIPPGKNGEENA